MKWRIRREAHTVRRIGIRINSLVDVLQYNVDGESRYESNRTELLLVRAAF